MTNSTKTLKMVHIKKIFLNRKKGMEMVMLMVDCNQSSQIQRKHRQFWCTGGEHSGSVVKNVPANVGDMGLIPESGRSPGVGNGNPLQCSCLGNPVDRGTWQATGLGLAKDSNPTEWLNNTRTSMWGEENPEGFRTSKTEGWKEQVYPQGLSTLVVKGQQSGGGCGTRRSQNCRNQLAVVF